ncbi:hypothetical protein V6N11_054629 [Hibiscus sabdariffa]|uniref:BED-type domain-containing protein n=1 Tax=Hibiscus sabdariffa TaxID=183260 RepID=A0ABR2S524_9ROSI
MMMTEIHGFLAIAKSSSTCIKVVTSDYHFKLGGVRRAKRRGQRIRRPRRSAAQDASASRRNRLRRVRRHLITPPHDYALPPQPSTQIAVKLQPSQHRWLFIMDMESNATRSGSSVSLDLTRKYGKPDHSNRNKYLCNFCGKITNGGAYRMKQHLVRGFTSVRKCPQCPEHVREEVKAFMLKKEEIKITNLMSSQDFSYDVDDHDEEEELEILNSRGNKNNSSQKSRIPLPKKPRVKCPMDFCVAPKANPHK